MCLLYIVEPQFTYVAGFILFMRLETTRQRNGHLSAVEATLWYRFVLQTGTKCLQPRGSRAAHVEPL